MARLRWMMFSDADLRAVAALYRAARRDRVIRAEMAGGLAASLSGMPVAFFAAAFFVLAPDPAPAALLASEDACAETRAITMMVVTPAGPVFVHVIACARRCYVERSAAPDCRTDAARRRIETMRSR